MNLLSIKEAKLEDRFGFGRKLGHELLLAISQKIVDIRDYWFCLELQMSILLFFIFAEFLSPSSVRTIFPGLMMVFLRSVRLIGWFYILSSYLSIFYFCFCSSVSAILYLWTNLRIFRLIIRSKNRSNENWKSLGETQFQRMCIPVDPNR